MNNVVQPALDAYDVEAIRADFPILAERPYGKPLVYLDNAASAQKPRQVIDRLTHAYEHEYANVHRGLHYLANAATEAYEAARETVRRFLNAASHEEIVFTRSATEAINLVASSFGLAHIGAGDEIVLSVMEHHSNIVPWHFHRERKGAVLALGRRRRRRLLFARGVRARAERSHEDRRDNADVQRARDSAADQGDRPDRARARHSRARRRFAGRGASRRRRARSRRRTSTFSPATRFMARPELACSTASANCLETLPPYQGGGEMIEEVTRETVTYNHPPHRFEAGTPPIVQAIGLGAALDYMEGIGRARIRAHEEALCAYAHELLSSINSLRIIGDAEGKGPIVSFTMEGAHAHDIATLIDRSGVAVRAGTHCAMPLLQRFGVTSTCRASFALYNTFAEVEALAESLVRARKLFQ